MGLPVALWALAFVYGCHGSGRSGLETVAFTSEDWSFGRAEGVKLTTDHYALHTTCSSKPLLDAMPGFLESCWQAYAKVLPNETTLDAPLRAYLFRKRWEWERFTEKFAPSRSEVYKRIRSGGYSERGVTVSHYSSRRATLSVMAHEGLHQYIEVTRGRRVPAWLNEGLACYFEAFDLDANNRPVFQPTLNTLRRRSLREAVVHHRLIPLKEILSTHAGHAIQKRGNHVRSYYSQVWSLVLFLIRPDRDNSYGPGFTQLLDELGTEAMDGRARAWLAADASGGDMAYGEAVFRAYVTDDLEGFQADYEAYLCKLLKLES